jgi:hypothetical protein
MGSMRTITGGRAIARMAIERMPSFALAAALGAATLAAACSGAGDASSPDAGACFVAFNPTFDGFRNWKSYAYTAPSEGSSGVHIEGPRTEYIQAVPPHGSTSFPVGTVIVKEVDANDPLTHHIYAMVKRGCDFNAGGATNWEWMELTEAAPGATILWRGAAPPAGETYLGSTTCNPCHVACPDNDDVCSQYIRLSNY